MTDKLYIIGNGFDLHHELRTSYADFRDYYVRKVPSLWNALLDIYGDVPRNDDLWWKDFENMLGKVDYDCLSKSRNGESLGFMKVRNLFKGKLPPLFGTWINDVNSQIDASKTELMRLSLYGKVLQFFGKPNTMIKKRRHAPLLGGPRPFGQPYEYSLTSISLKYQTIILCNIFSQIFGIFIVQSFSYSFNLSLFLS